MQEFAKDEEGGWAELLEVCQPTLSDKIIDRLSERCEKKLLRKQPELHISLRVCVWVVHNGAIVVTENGGRNTAAGGCARQCRAGWEVPGLRRGRGAGVRAARGCGRLGRVRRRGAGLNSGCGRCVQ